MPTGAKETFDVIIIGAGPVGAVAANLAGAAGLRTLIIERGDAPYSLPRAIVFDAEIMRVFDSVGLAETIADVTRPLGGSVYLGADRKPIRTFRAHPKLNECAWYPSNLFYQPQLEALLRAGLLRFENVTLLTGHDVIAIESGADTVSITAKDQDGGKHHVEGRFVLGCDGASSTVRKKLGIGLDDIGFEERWLVVDTFVNGAMRWPADHEIPDEVRNDTFSLMVCDPERPCTLIPGSGLHRRWEYMLLEGEADAEVLADEWIRAQIGRWIDVSDVEIIRAAVYRFRALVARNWRAGRVFLVGDAAHQTPPFYGQGMCHGIRDAAQLMWRLRLVLDGVLAAEALDDYQAERDPHVRAIISASVAAGAEVCKLDREEALARDAAFRAAEHSRGKQVAMTDIVPPLRAGTIDASTGGMRLPEFAVTRGAAAVHIDHILAGRFTVLSLDPVERALPVGFSRLGGQSISLSAENDPDGAIQVWFASRDARWAVVRPDRYVFATGSGETALEQALSGLCVRLSLVPRSAPTHQRSTAEAILP